MPNNLKLFAYQSGEQYITKAALIANERTEVRIYPGTDSLYQTWTRAAQARKKNVIALFSSKYNRSFGSEQEVKDFLKPMLQRKANEMADFLRTGVPFNKWKPNRVRVMPDENVKGEVQGSTDTAIEPFLHDPDRAQKQLHGVIARSVPESSMRARLREFYLEQGFSPDKEYTLLWGRSSGRTSAAGPHLDTNAVMMGQMMVSIRRIDPHRQLVVIGDPIDIPTKVGNGIVPPPDMNLFQYWRKNDWPGEPSDMSAQMFFLALIQSHHPKTVSVGTNSGILELPHLMGMRTIYLEDEHDRARKGLRWIKKEPMGNIDRFSTTTATDLWGRKNILFEEVREWMKENGRRMPGAYPGEDNAFLNELIQLTSLNSTAPAVGQESRPFAKQLAKVSEAWGHRATEPFAGSRFMRDEALSAMENSALRDGLTERQVEKFEELWRTGMNRGRQKQTNEQWNQVLAEQQREPLTPDPADGTDLEPLLA